MPTYVYRCGNKHETTTFFRVRDYVEAVDCAQCDLAAVRVFTPLALAVAKPDLCYDSPIDGTPITSWAARREDLKRNHCVEYDPEMKTDAGRHQQEQDAALSAKIDQSVGESIARMPEKKRNQLKKEVLAQGADMEVTRV